MSDPAWIDAALTSARPQAVGALLRYFRDLDTAEEAFQDACLRALKNWPVNGPPRDPAAWLIMVGRNSGIDAARRRSKQQALPSEDAISDLDDVEAPLAERLDGADYRDDILRLLFICCHPDLPAVQQVAVALRIVCGLSVKQIARAFLVGESAMEQRITRAKARIGQSNVGFDTPGPAERSERLARLLLRLFGSEPEIMGLTALMLIQHARAPARFAPCGELILLEDQDRSLWNRALIAEGLALIDKALRHASPGPYQVQASIAAMHARAARAQDTDWRQIDALYAALERMTPSPVVTLNRAVAVSKISGPEAALAMIEPLAQPLAGYFYFYGVKGALLMQLDRNREAREAFNQAIGLAGAAAEAAHIRQQLDRLAKDSEEVAKA